MKRTFAVMLGLMTVVFLSACGNKDVENTDVQNDNTDVEQVNEVLDENEVDTVEGDVDNESSDENNSNGYTKSSLTIEDLDQIDATLFPLSYNYETYSWEDEDTSDSGSFTYPEGVDHSLLIPIHEQMESREVVSSGIEDWMIYTIVNATLKDGTVVSILYINDPVTLKYIAASVNWDTETTLYSFVY